jgi:hypothetical protein
MPEATYKELAAEFNARGPEQTRKPDALKRKLNPSPPSEQSYYFWRHAVLMIVARAQQHDICTAWTVYFGSSSPASEESRLATS